MVWDYYRMGRWEEEREEGGGTSKKRGAKRAEVKKYRDPVKEDYMLWVTRSGDRYYWYSGIFHPSLPHSYKLQLGNSLSYIWFKVRSP